ncbi:UDP-N-acetylmuramoylalanyl-D-glutamyl-2,6-diaminopimelate--D-alanyl-D-alanine ligase [Novispirillum sp. DQ9]|uniref:UDP-N-acetylmuramoylalanyl-D-glutamyl-2, 6-diaminopimelate--D-alanyl-D-alanine ligase n=1 Tax=Novispirillum sp. DQ9 TaxID=3398612 RepID=UPI003C7BF603
MSLWTSDAIAKATNGTVTGAFTVEGVSIDSRTVAAGDLFIALVGPTHDGHAHVAQALAAGAAGALVHSLPEGVDRDRLILVDDTFDALNDLGRAGRDRFSGKVVGVTGSVGKTSTKEMLALVLAAFGPTHAAVGSFNNHWGVPLTLARMPADAAFAVIEMGMNHAGEITPLAKLARPHVAVITTIAPVHIEFFDGIEGIADAKAEIFAGCEDWATAVLPRDSAQYDRLAHAAHARGLTVLPFGEHAEAGSRLLDASVEAERTLIFAIIGGHKVTYSIGASGRHWASNSLAVLGACHALGLPVDEAARPLATMTPPKGRGARRRVSLPAERGEGSILVVDESYNASPTAVAAALAALAAVEPGKRGRRIAVLGDMLELGRSGPDLHAGLAEPVQRHGIDLVYTAGPLMAHLREALPPHLRGGGHAPDSQALAPVVAAAVRGGDVVMVKGSAGSRMGRVVEALLTLDQTPDPAKGRGEGH